MISERKDQPINGEKTGRQREQKEKRSESRKQNIEKKGEIRIE